MKFKYIPDRILLGLSCDTLFAATRRAQPALGRQNHFKIEVDFTPGRWRISLPSLHPALLVSSERSPLGV